MFRFIHTADLHLDSPLQGLEYHEGAPVALLRGATRRAFENVVQLALDEAVDFVVIAGDIYDGDWKDYSSGLFFRGQMVRLGERGIPVYLIAGNHDAASVISKKLSLPDNVHVFSTRTSESMEVPGLPVVIHGRGFPHRAVPENFAQEYPAAVAGKFNLGLLHTSLAGSADHDTYAPCSVADLQTKGYGYWALGHIHQPAVVCEDPWIVFSGNCQGRHVKEAGPRGCRLVTVDDSLRVVEAEWRPVDVVRWAQIAVDLGGCIEEAEAFGRVQTAMEYAVAQAEGRPVAARVIFSGATTLHGGLHRDRERWHSELLARAQDQGADMLWIERLKVVTTPVYDVAQLAERDPLTKTVVESLAGASAAVAELPADIREMAEVLPPEVRREFEAEWAGPGRQAVLDDVRAIIIDALATRGGSES